MGNDKPKLPKYNAPVTRVTVAFPFSNINMGAPDKRVKELAAIVVELARVLEDVTPGGAGGLLERAEACLASLDV